MLRVVDGIVVYFCLLPVSGDVYLIAVALQVPGIGECVLKFVVIVDYVDLAGHDASITVEVRIG